MIWPAQPLLSIHVYKLTEKTTVKSGILTNENSISPLDLQCSEEGYDVAADLSSFPPPAYLFPSKAVYFHAGRITVSPHFWAELNNALKRCFLFICRHIHDFESNIYSPMPGRVKSRCLN